MTQNKKLLGKCYDTRYLDYVYVDNIGRLILPNRLTKNFIDILRKNNLRKIRFHDLRHTCASLMLANNVPMKQIQEWLGHADFSTTANIYSHLDYSSKLDSANTLSNIFDFNKTTIKEENNNNNNKYENELEELKAKLAQKEHKEAEFLEWKKQKEKKQIEDIEM